ncbi:MAG: hypothetical protein IPK75_19980 [Acidobacteria bacterium]|nr:hypothetical protein [Acidobacteriota bacterium]
MPTAMIAKAVFGSLARSGLPSQVDAEKFREQRVIAPAGKLHVAAAAIEIAVARLRIAERAADRRVVPVLVEVLAVAAFLDRLPCVGAFVLRRRQQVGDVADIRWIIRLDEPEKRFDPVNLRLVEFAERVAVAVKERLAVDDHRLRSLASILASLRLADRIASTIVLSFDPDATRSSNASTIA